MLETYFSAPKMLGYLRSGPSGPYLDGFAALLKQDSYSPATAVRYLRAAAHLGHFVHEQGGTLAEIDPPAFGEHLRACRCPRSKGGRRDHHTVYGAQHFRGFLLAIGVCRPAIETPEIRHAEPEVIARFRAWLRKHHGAANPTIRLYTRHAASLVMALGNDPRHWDAAGVRNAFMERAGQSGKGTVEKLITSLRAFLRYLAVQGLRRADLDKAVPAYARRRLAELPRYLTAAQVNGLLAACDGDAPGRRRDRAILLLLARLGLRAGDVAQLRFADIEWETGSLRVRGKSRYRVRLPLPQDVGDAIIAYLECRPPASRSDYVFPRNTIERYLAPRRAAGFAMQYAECLLKSFASFAAERGETHVRAQTAIDWAALGPSVARRDARLKAVCRFARAIRIEDDRHQEPPANYFGARKKRRPPHIYSAEEINRLIEGAPRLQPRGGLRSQTHATLIALLAATGLRISEALKLRIADMTQDGLLIRETKFRKTRLTPPHDTAAAGLARYLSLRQPRSGDDPVLIDKHGRRLRHVTVRDTFHGLVRRIDIRPAPGGRRPRLHDPRHTFAVRALLSSPPGRSRGGKHMVALATYMGHVNIYSTYGYLEATADLMRDVAAAGEAFLSGEARS